MALAIRVGLLVCFITECNAMQVHMDHDPVFVLLSGSKLSEHKKAHMPESLPVTVPWEMSPSPTPSITIARVASPTTTSQQRAHGSDEQTNPSGSASPANPSGSASPADPSSSANPADSSRSADHANVSTAVQPDRILNATALDTASSFTSFAAKYLQDALELVSRVQRRGGSSTVPVVLVVAFLLAVTAAAIAGFVKHKFQRKHIQSKARAISCDEAKDIYEHLSKSHELFCEDKITKEALLDMLVQHGKIKVIPSKRAQHTAPIYKQDAISTICTLVIEGKLTIESKVSGGLVDSFKSEALQWQLLGAEALIERSYKPDFTATIPKPPKDLKVERHKMHDRGLSLLAHRLETGQDDTVLLQIDRVAYINALQSNKNRTSSWGESTSPDP